MQLVFRVHALQRMFERRISVSDVEGVLDSGKAIEDYPDDFPLPSRLMSGWVKSRPLHVVVADDTAANERIIITVYEPDPDQWDAAFETRKL